VWRVVVEAKYNSMSEGWCSKEVEGIGLVCCLNLND
jgi:hypothetical protein